ncbi:MAG: transporter [Xanthomonadales bacterium]|nr:transporter [Xanthomonadales bacterium]
MFRVALTSVLLTVMSVTEAQERIADFDDSIRLDYHYVHTGDFHTDTYSYDAGTTDTHALQLSGVFSLNEKWKIYGSIPYVRKRLVDPTGYGTHNPQVDFYEYTPPDLRFVDDGDYHGGFQDLTFGVQYLALDGPLRVSPFVSYGAPVSDYPIYGSAIIGRGLNELHLGVSLDFTPYFSDWNFQADISYVISEKVVGVDLNYWLVYLSARYFVTPRFAPRLFLVSRNAPNALNYPEDFEPYEEKYDNENGWRHDQTINHKYINAGIGFDYIFSERYGFSATYYRTIKAENLVEVDNAFNLGFTRRF